MAARMTPTPDSAAPQGGVAERSDADLLRLIAQDHARLAPNAYHSAATLLQIADRLEALAPAQQAGVEDALREALEKEARDWRHNAYSRVVFVEMHDRLVVKGAGA